MDVSGYLRQRGTAGGDRHRPAQRPGVREASLSDGAAAILAVNTSTGILARIPIGGNGAAGALTLLPLPRPLRSPDGLRIWRGRGIVVEQLAGELTSVDLETGQLTTLAAGLREPTSLELWRDQAWISEGQLSHLINQTAAELPFTVVRVSL